MYKLKVWHVHVYIKNTGKGKNLDKLSVGHALIPITLKMKAAIFS